MAKHFETFEHPADIGLQASADSLGGLFEAAAEGLAEQMCPRATVRPVRAVRIDVAAEDVEALLVDFLSAVLRRFDLDRFLLSSVRVERIDAKAVSAEVRGETYDPARHELAAEIKAVTYHQLAVARDGNGWTARVILDV